MIATIKQAIINSLTALKTNKSRSFLTMLGIIIGVAAVILIMSLGAGAQGLILNQVKSLGTNSLGITPGKSEKNGPPASVMGVVVTTLSSDDLQSINTRRRTPNILGAVGYAMGYVTTSWKNNSYDTSLNGCSANYSELEKVPVAEGRFFNSDEEQNLAKVVVLGSTAKEELFGDSDAVGQRIKIKKQIFEVIGVLAPKGKVLFQDYDDQVVVPLKTAQKLLLGINHLNYIRAFVDNDANIDSSVRDIEELLRDRHDISDQSGDSDDFSVRSASQGLDMLRSITDGVRFFLIAMAAISLLVGGIGIMNIMLISVNERTREIGLRKAVGANNFHIALQFLIEAAVLTLVGGAIGIIVGTVLSLASAFVIRTLGYNWDFVISITAIFLSLAVSTLVGLVFGFYPARKASKLEPVEALSYE